MPGQQDTPSTEERDPLLASLQDAGMPTERPPSRLRSWAHAIRTFNWHKPSAAWYVEHVFPVSYRSTETDILGLHQ